MTDIGPLIRVGLMVIGLAMATGHYRDLRRFATVEAVRASRGWHLQPFFDAGGRRASTAQH